ncbi:MAG: Membrane protein [Candidatus Wolfebacteria bacterium GW2011_GWE1_48_7]|uniref:Membrane protein n=2 Tax=Candidatus Wolfeibacteriota TaxID=1752735 RepID=A0A0G1X697_9BACT|nr:MAG: Membrane protein [Candidatus Wolfebacteria bacterium GW2011_GWB1_47_1]KKU36899.1 MAG: Membrane protein [Candidatus Wolfebacteria bacterium GW2011_GWC2_46_275]KKU41599.1 MAG: Membrane protein [Candidatus Wolfebacteria bacterium GW2011_GWB2_46_69]KKU53768.1 MAG: Membrane protein [Candidatus Wolfebacteria bacterium GW2011_GWC1_47_103]KKU59887.1 MAG: Membrane protein [Candidatus Wolfebacteria bacterium GW2011_GWE2_47_12]KKU65879.1 MAG: Membrane protein [Candidatus Wolfebacteria bacterium G
MIRRAKEKLVLQYYGMVNLFTTDFRRMRTHEGFKRYFKNTGWLFLGRLGGMAISFYSSVYLVRYLGPENNGALSYALSFVALFGFLASLGIDSILYRDLVDRPHDRDKLLGTALGLKIIGSLITIAAIFTALPFMYNDARVNLIIIIIAASLIFQSFNVFQYFFQANLLSKHTTVVYLTVTALLTTMKLSVIWLHKGLLFIALVLFLEPILYFLGHWFVYQRQQLKISQWQFDHNLARSMFIVSLPLILSSAFASIAGRIDQVMIKQLMDIRSVGLYDAAVRIAEVWYFVPSIIISSVFPAIVNAKKVGHAVYRNRLIKLTLYVFLGSVAVALPIYLFAPLIIRLLYGVAYMPAVGVLRIYVWAGIGVGMAAIVNNYLIIEHRTSSVFFVNFFSMAMNVLLNLYLIPKFGISGAALATLISYIAIPIIAIIINNKKRYEK